MDSRSGLAHSAVVTSANVHDKHPIPQLLHGAEQRVYGDSAYASQKPLIQAKAPLAKDFTNQRSRRLGQERHALVRGAGSGQHLPRTKNTVWTGAPIAHDKRANGSRRGRKGLGNWRNARRNRTVDLEMT